MSRCFDGFIYFIMEFIFCFSGKSLKLISGSNSSSYDVTVINFYEEKGVVSQDSDMISSQSIVEMILQGGDQLQFTLAIGNKLLESIRSSFKLLGKDIGNDVYKLNEQLGAPDFKKTAILYVSIVLSFYG